MHTMVNYGTFLADDVVGRYHLERMYKNVKDFPYIHHDSTVINPQVCNALIHLRPSF